MNSLILRKIALRSIIAVISASLITSCAYEGTPYNSGTTTGRNGNDSVAPLLVGAAAIGALVLAKRHSDKKRKHNDKYHRGYNHDSNYRYNNGYNRGYDRNRNCDNRNYGHQNNYPHRW